MKIKNYIIFIALCACVILSGCQWTITGQNYLGKIKSTTDHADKSKYDLVGIHSHDTKEGNKRIIKDPDVVTIYLKTLYLKHIQSVCDFNVLIYAEVYDLIDEREVLRRIAFHSKNQPPNSYVNVYGNILYGPIHFKGYPIKIKFYVLELDRENNEQLSQLVDVAASVATAAQPQYGPAIGMAASIMQVIISLNEDDLEFSQEITLYPASENELTHYEGVASLVAPLETGDFVIVKREDKNRIIINNWWWFADYVEKDATSKFNTKNVRYDVKTGRLTKEEGGDTVDFEDKTYAVLTITRSPNKAVDRALLEEVSNNVQATLNTILIDAESAKEERIAAIKRMGQEAIAQIELFNLKNRLSGKSSEKRKEILNKEIDELEEKEKTEEGLTYSEELTLYVLKHDLERITDEERDEEEVDSSEGEVEPVPSEGDVPVPTEE